ncbi:DNA adenine methylase [Helicobacter sp. MIT 05-5294]|uniref:DNA adenine methylase n=1 Tax=Helicobacter sp. MIT 05-5294 TaxID=1548150 RepID=UPI00051F8F09|nr:DNA adenine methylase [Helicobacter sp. MIT 05-5294]TLD87241.1 DNA methyltransferase [Helicobacter sp. MIT 05-5294]
MRLANRRYTGAKTRLLKQIDVVIRESFDYSKAHNLSFFDVFAGTGVVSEYFMEKPQFGRFVMNDFLDSNFAIYQAFFAQDCFNIDKLKEIQAYFQHLDSKTLEQNYYSEHFGGKFFSHNDALIIGEIREQLDKLLQSRQISQKEFYVLLASLLYSSDRIANTVGHYDAYRKNISLQDRFIYELIEPIKSNAKIEIYKEDSNALAKEFVGQKEHIDIAFIDPPYNSRQYSRFYHLLETLATNTKPKLYGVALKPQPQNISRYCKVEAKEAFKDLIENLAKVSKVLVVTYNNTCNANVRSNVRLKDKEIKDILEPVGKISLYEFDYKAFSSGKSSFKNHKERVFLCQI